MWVGLDIAVYVFPYTSVARAHYRVPTVHFRPAVYFACAEKSGSPRTRSIRSVSESRLWCACSRKRREMAMAARSLGRLAANSCYFFLCDMQEKFRPSIRYYPEIITVAKKMVGHEHRAETVASTVLKQ